MSQAQQTQTTKLPAGFDLIGAIQQIRSRYQQEIRELRNLHEDLKIREIMERAKRS